MLFWDHHYLQYSHRVFFAHPPAEWVVCYVIQSVSVKNLLILYRVSWILINETALSLIKLLLWGSGPPWSESTILIVQLTYIARTIVAGIVCYILMTNHGYQSRVSVHVLLQYPLLQTWNSWKKLFTCTVTVNTYSGQSAWKNGIFIIPSSNSACIKLILSNNNFHTRIYQIY